MWKRILIGMAVGICVMMSGGKCEAAEASNVDEEILSQPQNDQVDGSEPYDWEAGDGQEMIVTKTEKNDVNSAQVSFKAVVPEHFNLGVYVEIRRVGDGSDVGDTGEEEYGDANGCIYRIMATATNEYIGRMFVPAGKYEIVECAVDGDVAMKYPMTVPEGFEVGEGGNAVLECTMVEFEEVQAEAYERVGSSLSPDGKMSDAEKEYRAYAGAAGEERTGEDGLADDFFTGIEETVYPWREVEHMGDGYAEVKIRGVSNGFFDYVFVITATGKPGKGEFKYSVDGGENFSDVMVIPAGAYELTVPEGSGGENYVAGEKTGLSVDFTPGDEYLVYDEYRFSSVREYALRETGSQYGDGAVQLCSETELFDVEYRFGLRIVKTGAMGEAEFEYTLDGRNWSESGVVPADGIFHIKDAGLVVRFCDCGGEFVVGDEWSAEVKGSTSRKDYGGVIIAVVVVLVVIYLMTVLYYAGLKDKPADYRVNTYEPVDYRRNGL